MTEQLLKSPASLCRRRAAGEDNINDERSQLRELQNSVPMYQGLCRECVRACVCVVFSGTTAASAGVYIWCQCKVPYTNKIFFRGALNGE